MLVKAVIVINVILCNMDLLNKFKLLVEKTDLLIHIGVWIKWISEMFELLFSS